MQSSQQPYKPYFPLPPAVALRFHVIFPEGFWKEWIHVAFRELMGIVTWLLSSFMISTEESVSAHTILSLSGGWKNKQPRKMLKAISAIRRNLRGTVKEHIEGNKKYTVIKLLLRECTNEPIKTSPAVTLAMVGCKLIMWLVFLGRQQGKTK